VKAPAERKQERREAKLEQIERDVRDGKLVVRQMTAAERAKYPPRPRPGRRARRA
jgi:hypothetical protein